MNKKIGVIGGMGPMASQLFYKMITEKTEAEKDQDHVNLVLVSDASMPDRTSAILAGDYDEVSEKLLKDAKILEMCGCEAIGITCNTAHFFADLIKDELEIPIIHMIEETVQHISRKSPGAKVAVLATDGTEKHLLPGEFDRSLFVEKPCCPVHAGLGGGIRLCQENFGTERQLAGFEWI